MNRGIRLGLSVASITTLVLLTLAMLSTFERPPVQTVQRGYRGVAMVENYNPRFLSTQLAANRIPPSLPELPASGPRAGAVYKNVEVLRDLSVGQFTRLMASITTWVAPQQGCTYCHNAANMADDTLYQKKVARRMLQMVQHINSTWKTHVQGTGVTCWTCHRGQPVPSQIWFRSADTAPQVAGMAEAHTGKNLASAVAGDASLPYDPFTPFLEEARDIRVQGTTALPDGNLQSIKQTDWTYSLMIHFATSLGVNCTYCHNSRAFSNWSQSTPQRVTAWYGIRMVRDINNNYLKSLAGIFPLGRLGLLGDVPKANCATCHQGAYKPLYGVSMIKSFPELAGNTDTLPTTAATTAPPNPISTPAPPTTPPSPSSAAPPAPKP